MKNPGDIDTITNELTAILLKKQQRGQWEGAD